MGTRHLIFLYYAAKAAAAAAKSHQETATARKPRIAQYGQWDGYASVIGVNLVKWLATSGNIEKLKRALENDLVYSPEQPELDELQQKAEWLDRDLSRLRTETEQWSQGQEEELKTSDPAQYELLFKYGSTSSYLAPNLSGDTGWEILPIIAEAKTRVPVILDDFSAEWPCEWAYVIDLDENVFEVYRGRLRGFDDDDFPPVEADQPEEPHLSRFSGQELVANVRLIRSYPLDRLPSERQLVADCMSLVEKKYDEMEGENKEVFEEGDNAV